MVAIGCLDLVGATVMHARGGLIFLSFSAARASLKVWAVLDVVDSIWWAAGPIRTELPRALTTLI